MKATYFYPFLLWIVPNVLLFYFLWTPEVFNGYPDNERNAIIGLCMNWFFALVAYTGGVNWAATDSE